MKNKFIYVAAAVLVLGSCARTETVETPADRQHAVTFGGYSGTPHTKAGPTVDMNLDALKTHGFGVFATYTGTDSFASADNLFMNNQDVTYNGSVWTYSPIRYWPNPTGGKSAAGQHVSFFAYAPFCTPGTSETSGITGFEIDGATGHNLVHYAFDPVNPNVDLMWGYKAGTDPKAPNLDLTREDGIVHFVFRHMLSKLGGSQEGETDRSTPGYVANGLIIRANPTAGPTNVYGSGALGDFGSDTGTKITVSEIIVESAPEEDPVGTPVLDANGAPVVYATGPQPGTLDLYSGEFTLDGTPTPAARPVQFYQKISADAAALAGGASALADYLKEVPGVMDFTAVKPGVLLSASNVYADEANPIILLPGTAPVVDVTITYTVRTYDAKLPRRSATEPNSTFTEVPQTVFGRVKFPTIEQNKKYNLCIIVGLNHVEFSALVEDWTPGEWVDANGDGIIDAGELTGTQQEISLPSTL